MNTAADKLNLRSDSKPDGGPHEVRAPSAPAPRGSRKTAVVVGLALTLGAVATAYWARARHFEDTDDAQVDGDISNVSPRVSGTLTAVRVSENQTVKAGDVLAEIDPEDLKIAVDQAKAALAQAQALLAAEDPSVPITVESNENAVATAHSNIAAAVAALSAARSNVQHLSAQLAQAQANNRQAQLEKGRAEKLLSERAIAQADYDGRVNAAAASEADVRAIEESVAAARDSVTQQEAQLGALQSHLTEVKSNAPRQVETRKASVAMRQAALNLAKAQLEQAERNLSYAKIVAPVSGIVAKKSIAVGDHVQPGQLVVAITASDSLWITANFRETQLERIATGQPVTVHVDALNLDLRGSVDSLGGATGSRLSVLPPENAAGNYVKVVQRIPVRVRLEPGQPGLERLRIGMSAEPKVTIQ